MDAEVCVLLTLPGDPDRTPEKQTVGTVTASHKMLTLEALSSSLNTGTAKRGCLGRGEAFGCPPAVRPPKRPRPFAHCRFNKAQICSAESRDHSVSQKFKRIRLFPDCSSAWLRGGQIRACWGVWCYARHFDFSHRPSPLLPWAPEIHKLI